MNESKKKYMETRTDVLKKTILRALRKEYEHYFVQFLECEGYNLEYSNEQFRTYLFEYSEYLKSFNDPNLMSNEYGNLQDLPFTIGLLIDFCKMKRMEKTSHENDIMNLFNQVLYKYSHAKFDKLLSFPSTKFLFRQVLTPEFSQAFILRHETLRKSPEKYEACIQELIKDLSN